jgi:uncharacterized protein (TIGR03083 family)
MEIPAYRVQLVQSESEQLLQYLTGLPPEAWHHPSACHRWEVRDVVGHLIAGAEFYAGTVSRGLQGDVSPPTALPAGTGQAAASERIAQRAIAVRESLGDQLLATFKTTHDHLTQLLATVSPRDWETCCYHPLSLLPVRTFVDLRLTEVVMHGWDIRSRCAPDASLSPESLPAFLDLLPVIYHRAFRPEPRSVLPIRYRFEGTDLVSTSTDIVVDGDQVRLEPRGAVPADVIFSGQTASFILLMYGRLNLHEAIADGRLAVDGNTELVPAFAQGVRGI